MKAALEAWGMSHNAFQHGFAKQTEDPAIVAAATAKPGVVLKRAVGTSGPFEVNAALPDMLPNIRPPGRVAAFKPKPPPKRKVSPRKAAKRDSAAILSFEKAHRKRQQERAKEEARLAKERKARKKATRKAEAELETAQQAHRKTIDALVRQRTKVDAEIEKENDRWEVELEKLEDAVERARE